MDLIIHGVYDATTLKTLQQLKVSQLGFDLRGRSLNLIAFHDLKSMLPQITQKAYLTFENDLQSTVGSFLNLLGNDKNKFTLEFRDNQTAHYYESFKHPYSWFFRPDGDWASILESQRLEALVLPVKFKSQYQNMPKLWHIIQERVLPVILHVETLEDIGLYVREKNLTLSVDLGRELECGFRKIDQARLQNLSIWRNLNETFAGQ
jgi:hypothetical protein